MDFSLESLDFLNRGHQEMAQPARTPVAPSPAAVVNGHSDLAARDRKQDDKHTKNTAPQTSDTRETQQVNGHGDSTHNTNPENPPDIYNARTIADIKATLSHLHDREAAVTARLDALVASQKDFSRELGRLDLLRAQLGSQVTTTRAISHGMLADAARTADRISSAVKRLDLQQSRVKATLDVVEQVVELKACVLGVAGSMGASQDWEMAASYMNRASKIPKDVILGDFAVEIVPTAEVPDPPSVTLENAAESLCGLFLREFERAVKDNDDAKITRFFKLFPLIGRSAVGLDVYGRYVCQGVATRARANLHSGPGGELRKDGFFYANALTKLFEHIAQIVDGHGALVERHYGQGKMTRVVERLQVEADVQGGIILESWSDDRHIDRKLTDIKSYAFTFLVQSFLPAPRGMGTPRANSPASRDVASQRSSEDEGVDMKEIDGLLNEMAIMLGRWSLYSRFLTDKCMNGDEEEFKLPEFLAQSALCQKISDRLIHPFNAMTTFFLRRSVEKAFQLDEGPPELTLNRHQPLRANPPHITSAVDDVMYIVNKVLQQSLRTSQHDVMASVTPTLARVLGTDFIGMIQRKMRDESYPRGAAGGAPSETTIIAFLVLLNNLDVAIEYIQRIVKNHVEPSKPEIGRNRPGDTAASESPLANLFPLGDEAQRVGSMLKSFSSSFESKAQDLVNDGTQVLFNNVIKAHIRPILAESFRDIEYQPRDDVVNENDVANGEGLMDEADGNVVRHRFAIAWADLLEPIARILSGRVFERLLGVIVAALARLLEKRIWSYHGRVNALGATQLERDVMGIVSVAVDVGRDDGGRKGGGAGGEDGARQYGGARYRHREAFGRCLQIVMVMGMEEEEWEEVMRGNMEDVVDRLSVEERVRARGIVVN
ncbi:golgi transport complex subunit Cog4 [Histoplasma capsulatum G186AR]|uniref:Conserved oligomeric Golgi complex subunit 4 n=1 Tax=Ajellomyces capsulatus TaxID=5037 RepID=A0A8H7Z5Z4_AJECA|nr:golgi transport complex subunit Cog4 [Histoplasma capsulatum]QSS71846.1 golgi transport complex subunit Cog4 [Histoplasma capsulatum G186AR]